MYTVHPDEMVFRISGKTSLDAHCCVFFSVLLIPQNSRHPVLVIGTATQYCLPLLSLFLSTHYHESIATFAAAASAAPTAALFRKDSSQ